MEATFEIAVYGFAVIGFCRFVELTFFKEKSEPIDGFTYLPRVSRALGIEMELKLKEGVVTLWIYKPDAEPIEIPFANFDSRVRELANENKVEAIKFVRCVTGYGLRESKDYVDNMLR